MTYTFRDFSNIAISPARSNRSFPRPASDNTSLFAIVDGDTDIPVSNARIVFSRSSGCLFLNRDRVRMGNR